MFWIHKLRRAMRRAYINMISAGRRAIPPEPEPPPEPSETAVLISMSWTDFDTPYSFEHQWAMAGESGTGVENSVLSNTPEGARGIRYTSFQASADAWDKAQTALGVDTAYHTLRIDGRVPLAQAKTDLRIERIGTGRTVEWGFINNENHTLNSLMNSSERNAISNDPYYASTLKPMLDVAYAICALTTSLDDRNDGGFDISKMKGTHSCHGRAWDFTERYLNAKLYNDGVCSRLKAAYPNFRGLVIYRGGHRHGMPMPLTEYGYPQPYTLGYVSDDETGIAGAGAMFPRLEYIHSGVDSIYAWATNAVEVDLPEEQSCGVMGKTHDPYWAAQSSKYPRRITTSADLVLTNDLAKIKTDIACTDGNGCLVAPTVDYSQFQAGSTIVSYHRTPNTAPTYDPPHPGFVSRVRCGVMASRAAPDDAYALALSAWDSSSYDADGDEIPDQPCSDAQRQVVEDVMEAIQVFLGPGAHQPIVDEPFRYFGANPDKAYLPDGRYIMPFGQVCGDGKARYVLHVERPSMPQVWSADWEENREILWPAVTVDVYRGDGAGGETLVTSTTIPAGEAEGFFVGETHDPARLYRFEAQEGANACANAVTDQDMMGAAWMRSGDVTQASGGNTAPEDAASTTLYRIDDSGSYAETTISGLTPGSIVCASACLIGYSGTASGQVSLFDGATELEDMSGSIPESRWTRRYVTGVVPTSGTITLRVTGYRVYVCDIRLQANVYQPTEVE